jgi:hypothetical protein
MFEGIVVNLLDSRFHGNDSKILILKNDNKILTLKTVIPLKGGIGERFREITQIFKKSPRLEKNQVIIGDNKLEAYCTS